MNRVRRRNVAIQFVFLHACQSAYISTTATVGSATCPMLLLAGLRNQSLEDFWRFVLPRLQLCNEQGPKVEVD